MHLLYLILKSKNNFKLILTNKFKHISLLVILKTCDNVKSEINLFSYDRNNVFI